VDSEDGPGRWCGIGIWGKALINFEVSIMSFYFLHRQNLCSLIFIQGHVASSIQSYTQCFPWVSLGLGSYLRIQSYKVIQSYPAVITVPLITTAQACSHLTELVQYLEALSVSELPGGAKPNLNVVRILRS